MVGLLREDPLFVVVRWYLFSAYIYFAYGRPYDPPPSVCCSTSDSTTTTTTTAQQQEQQEMADRLHLTIAATIMDSLQATTVSLLLARLRAL
jgi:hypothetical protein